MLSVTCCLLGLLGWAVVLLGVGMGPGGLRESAASGAVGASDGNTRDRFEVGQLRDVPADTSPARPSVEARFRTQPPVQDGPRGGGGGGVGREYVGPQGPGEMLRASRMTAAIGQVPMAACVHAACAGSGLAARPPPVATR